MSGLIARLLNLTRGRSAKRQCGALCWRDIGGEVTILLITSRASRQWIIPKGWPMIGKTLAQAAAQEAWEEAGVQGIVANESVGVFHYFKRKSGTPATRIAVTVFPLHVTEEHDAFPELGQREKRWLNPAEAARIVSNDSLATLLGAFTPVRPPSNN